MPKRRNKENSGLPRNWRFKHGAYYYRVPQEEGINWDNKTEFRLGKTLKEAYKIWSNRLEVSIAVKNYGDLLDRYLLEIVPTNAPKTQESKRISITRLRKAFAHMPVTLIKPMQAYQYNDLVSKKHGLSSANRDLEVLSHSLTMAVRWGYIEMNPLKNQITKNRIKPRERYVEDWEIEEALNCASPVLKSYIKLKLLTGLRRGDLLRLDFSSLTDGGILVKTKKTGIPLLIEWTKELRQALEDAVESRPTENSQFIFCTKTGDSYSKSDGTASGFDSLWQRFMVRALKNTNLKEKFQEKDLRKKTASDMSLESAKELLGHTSVKTTSSHYRLKPRRVTPHSLIKTS